MGWYSTSFGPGYPPLGGMYTAGGGGSGSGSGWQGTALELVAGDWFWVKVGSLMAV